jgi:hypothetical protein
MKQGIEISREGKEPYIDIYGAITDVHMHPRIFDNRFPDEPDIPNGKAGLPVYTEAALRAGFSRGLAMLNESVRIHSPDEPDQTLLIPYPINNIDRLLATASVITQESLMKMGMIMLADRSVISLDEPGETFKTEQIEKIYSSTYVRDLAAGLKIFGAYSTGGYNIPLEYVIPVAEVWHKHNPHKPVVMHLEDEAVGEILSEWPAHIPAHIAHTSSRQELEPIITAIEDGKNVSCEATPHHLTLTEATRLAIGAYGCMKPTLKTPSDIKFLWDNIDYISIFASDCAPHRHIDKVGPDGKGLEHPAFGVTNHESFLPIYFQAILEGRLTERQLYERLVLNPAARFNLPPIEAAARFHLTPTTASQAARLTEYGQSVFTRSPETPPMAGTLDTLRIAGRVAVRGQTISRAAAAARYSNLVRL